MCDGVPSVPLHPDVVLIERGLYPPEVLGRSRPELQDISVDQIRSVVIQRAAYAPHEGHARVFIVRRAEELSISAGNALLKTLEEPGRNTYFILLVARPARLLSTVQSRTLRIRFAPLANDVLVRILVQQGVDEALARDVAPLAGGSASAALALADREASELRSEFVREALEAVTAGDATAALQLAEKRARGDKPALRANLEALAARFAHAAHQAAEHGDPRARGSALRYQIVLRAIRDMERNASPALLMENMLLRIRARTG
jgi:DNA polymerase-3 subunit delta'